MKSFSPPIKATCNRLFRSAISSKEIFGAYKGIKSVLYFGFSCLLNKWCIYKRSDGTGRHHVDGDEAAGAEFHDAERQCVQTGCERRFAVIV